MREEQVFPARSRRKPTIRPKTWKFRPTGETRAKIELGPFLNRNSIRHLADSRNGTVAFAMQSEGNLTEHPQLLDLHSRGEQPGLLEASRTVTENMLGYKGSVAVSETTATLAVTSPRGGLFQVLDFRTRKSARHPAMQDVCRVAPLEDGNLFASGTGFIMGESEDGAVMLGEWFPIR